MASHVQPFLGERPRKCAFRADQGQLVGVCKCALLHLHTQMRCIACALLADARQHWTLQVRPSPKSIALRSASQEACVIRLGLPAEDRLTDKFILSASDRWQQQRIVSIQHVHQFKSAAS